MPSLNQPNPFYSSDQTSQSRLVLDKVLDANPDAILIGGWATWYRTRGPMSHDIDLIVDYAGLEAIRASAGDFSESHHISGTKWRATIEGIHLDLYVSHRSTLGANLQLAVDALVRYDDLVEGRRLLTVPAHVATKFAALLDRPHSLPGRKDRHELHQLLALPDADQTPAVIEAASKCTTEQRQRLLVKAFDFLTSDPDITRRQREDLRSIAHQWTRKPIPPHLSTDQVPPTPNRGSGPSR